MMLTEQTAVPLAALPVQALRDHLRLGTGFSDDGLQDGVLESCLRAALGAIEGRTGKALLSRRFHWSISAWRDLGRQVLPVAPVSAIVAFAIRDRAGADAEIDTDRFRLEADLHRPAVVASGLVLPTIPVGGSAEITFDAGFGASWTDVPSDLGQAALMLAGHYYEHRHDMSASGGVPHGVSSLIERYRNVRLFGGSR